MIDLAPSIRAFLIADTDITDDLTTYAGQAAIFTRRPVPNDAQYPFIIISPQISQTENDLIGKLRRRIVYDIITYCQNDSNSNYNKCEEIAFNVANKFYRLNSADMEIPSGYKIVQAIGIGPFPASTDDLEKVARGVSVTFEIVQT